MEKEPTNKSNNNSRKTATIKQNQQNAQCKTFCSVRTVLHVCNSVIVCGNVECMWMLLLAMVLAVNHTVIQMLRNSPMFISFIWFVGCLFFVCELLQLEQWTRYHFVCTACVFVLFLSLFYFMLLIVYCLTLGISIISTKKKINNNTVHACIQKQNKNDEYIPGFHFASILESYSHTYSFKLIMDFGLSSCNEIHLCVFYIGNITKETKSEKNDERKTLKRKPNFMKQTKTIRTVQNLSKIIFRFFFVCTEDLFLLFSAIFKNQPEKKHWTE